MKKLVALLSVAWIFLTGCSIGSPEGDEVAKLADQLYHDQQAGDIDKLLSYYAGGRSPEQWRLELEHVQEKLGKVKSYQLKHSEVNTVLSGRYYIFEYQVTYDSGKQAKETVTFFDTVEADDRPAVVAHAISAEGFRPFF
jgi:hypothetical protein